MKNQIKLINNVSSDVLDATRKSKIFFLDLNILESNPMNKIYEDQDTIDDLEELEESIKEIGLQQPITVTKSDNNYVLLSGHRRIKALKKLFNSNDEIKYNGIVLQRNNVPAIIQYEYTTKEEQFKALVASNCYRRLSKETNKKIIAEAVKIYNIQLTNGKVVSGRTRDNIAKLANVSGRSIQRYVDIGQKGKLVKMKEGSQEEDLYQTIKNKLDRIKKYFTSIDTSNIKDLSNLKSAAISTIYVMVQKLDIDPKELWIK